MLDAGRVDAGALHVLNVLLSDAPWAGRHPVMTNSQLVLTGRAGTHDRQMNRIGSAGIGLHFSLV